jgi:hypothetical protein
MFHDLNIVPAVFASIAKFKPPSRLVALQTRFIYARSTVTATRP